MNILLISYGDYRYDGRLRELVTVFDSIGCLDVICIGESDKKNVHIINSSGYGDYIKKAYKKGLEFANTDILVIDNRRASIPGLKLAKKIKPNVIIQDCRELYLSDETHGLVGKVGCYFEQKSLKKADIVISANDERAKIMQKIYSLKEKPLVYENLRKLEYTNASREACEFELGKYINAKEYRIISTSGCSVDRTNDILVENLDKVEYNVRLFLVGNSSESDIERIKNIISEKNLNNVEIIGNLQQSQLKYLIENSHIGIVNYHQKDTNNKLCASGKVYEYIYENIPVVTTTNPPLKRLCDEYGIGRASNKYYDAINDVLNNYSEYKNNTIEFSETHKVEDNNKLLIEKITQKIEAILNK